MSKELLQAAIRQNEEEFAKIFVKEMRALRNKKETTTMQVTYNGFTGELVRLERKEAIITSDPFVCRGAARISVYDISIYDSEKQVTHSFTGVKM